MGAAAAAAAAAEGPAFEATAILSTKSVFSYGDECERGTAMTVTTSRTSGRHLSTSR